MEGDSEAAFETRFGTAVLSLVGVYAGGNELRRGRERSVFMLALEGVVPTLCTHPPTPRHTHMSTDNRYLHTFLTQEVMINNSNISVLMSYRAPPVTSVHASGSTKCYMGLPMLYETSRQTPFWCKVLCQE